MRSNVDQLTLTLFAALGLELAAVGCTPDKDPGSTGSTDSSGSTTDSSDSPTSTDSTGTMDSTTDSTDDSNDSNDSSDDSTTGLPTPVECNNPAPIMQLGTQMPSGFVQCDNGAFHRAEAVECLVPEFPTDDFCVEQGGCDSAADCQAKPYGGCVVGGDGTECYCEYGCATDADCDEGSICVCAGVLGGGARCVPSSCTTSDSCEDGLCNLSTRCFGCDPSYEFACAGPDAECVVSSDCEQAEPDGTQCSISPEGNFFCEPIEFACGSVCGRPLWVADAARVAEAIDRADWRGSSTIEVASIAPTIRRRLAEHWTRIAAFEHASVASFARASLDLLALGAPPALILATQQARADEIEHARLTFALASAYAGRSIGPGPLAIAGAIEEQVDVRVFVERLVVEACVGETLAALEACEAAAWADDPALASVLEQIAADELRHAQLGWQTLRWVLDQGDSSLRAFALDRLELALREAANEDAGESSGLREHGVLDRELRDALRRRAIESSLAPCLLGLRRQFLPSADQGQLVTQ